MSNFAQNLSLLRRRAGLTQEGLAEALDVSRQAVSKWEGGQTMPESEKLIPLAELLNCTLDQLMRDDLSQNTAPEEPDGQALWSAYARHMDRFAWVITAGVALALLGVAALTACYSVLGESGYIVLPLLLCEAGAVFLLVSGGLSHGNFLRATPIHPACTVPAARARFERLFPAGIAGAVAGIIVDTALLLALAVRFQNSEAMMLRGLTLFFLFLALCVGALVLLGIRWAKYQPEPAGRDWEAAIMLLATACFLAGGILWDAWSISWAAFPVGGLLCAVLSVCRKKPAD